jgi:hypothetical protein
VAYKTLEAIRVAIEKDQGAKYRGILRNLMPLAEDAYSEKNDPFRKHLGASLIGRECERAIWYGYRWTQQSQFPARILRLFNRGHLEEPRMVAALMAAGIDVWQFDPESAEGKQFRVSEHNGNFGGSLDGIAIGVPEALGIYVLNEFKTHNTKSFAKLAGDNWEKHLADPNKEPFRGEGVRAVKPEHYAQVQTYMRGQGLTVCLYMATNKDTDSLYAELLPYDKAVAVAYSARAKFIIYGNQPPKKLSESPTHFSCKYCDYREICHKKKAPLANCRTCEFSEPALDGRWYCKAKEVGFLHPQDPKAQEIGCEKYTLSHLFK